MNAGKISKKQNKELNGKDAIHLQQEMPLVHNKCKRTVDFIRLLYFSDLFAFTSGLFTCLRSTCQVKSICETTGPGILLCTAPPEHSEDCLTGQVSGLRLSQKLAINIEQIVGIFIPTLLGIKS